MKETSSLQKNVRLSMQASAGGLCNHLFATAKESADSTTTAQGRWDTRYRYLTKGLFVDELLVLEGINNCRMED